MEFFYIAAEAGERWRTRQAIRDPKCRMIREGKALEIEDPERIKLRFERLTQAAARAGGVQQPVCADGMREPVSLVESIGLERVIGDKDFLDINFLENALAVSRFVGRINIRSASGRSVGYGTGFMVSPRLLMTNHHVLEDASMARYSEVEFDYQNDRSGRSLPVVGFGLDPDSFFMNDKTLDFALVAVKDESVDGTALKRYGWSRLIGTQGKALLGESLNIIQHPKGQRKQIVLRSNQLVDLFEHFAHYVADTEPGSSGAPVYNDQWELVALHHSGVPRKDDQGNYIARDGSVWRDGDDPDQLDWVANEGIRVSSLVNFIKAQPLAPPQDKLREELLSLDPLPIIEVARDNRADRQPAVAGTGGTAVVNGQGFTIPVSLHVSLGEPRTMPGEPKPGRDNLAMTAGASVAQSGPAEVPLVRDADAHIDPIASDDLPFLRREKSLEATRQWRPAESLVTLRKQVDAAYPGRSTASDGMIGDSSHADRRSDHNPHIDDGGVGIVSAFDITHDPAHGCDAGRLAASIHASRDARVKYIIWNRRIANSSPIGSAPAWAWRTYTGANPHDRHCHISVKSSKAFYDDPSPWATPAAAASTLKEATAAPDESSRLADMEMALAALGSIHGKPLIQALVDTQETVSSLLSGLAAETGKHGRETVGAGLEAGRPDPAQLRSEYLQLFESCKINPSRLGEVAWHRNRLIKNRARYEEVAAITGAPWWFVGIVHALEASFNFATHLHNGDPLEQRTVQVPSGRPVRWNPPSDWVSSAVDAIQYEGYSGNSDWSLPIALFRFETYNGFGYRSKAIHSPYLWSFSNHYSRGKFVRDGKYDPDAVSRQCGAAVMLKALMEAGDVAAHS